MANTRPQAEIFYDGAVGNNTYTGVCAVGAGTINAGVLAAVGATNPAGLVVVGGLQTATNGVCNSSATAWAAQAPLKSSGQWCVDSTGASEANAILLGNVTVCP